MNKSKNFWDRIPKNYGKCGDSKTLEFTKKWNSPPLPFLKTKKSNLKE